MSFIEQVVREAEADYGMAREADFDDRREREMAEEQYNAWLDSMAEQQDYRSRWDETPAPRTDMGDWTNGVLGQIAGVIAGHQAQAEGAD